MERFHKNIIIKDLKKKMVLLAGPRQVGKTWLAKDISRHFGNPLYLNHDSGKDREIIQNESWLEKTDLLVLDELHKMRDWKNYLKGVWDTRHEHLKILVTGSARLEAYSHAGDSLAGRYFRHRLLPVTHAELKKTGSDADFDRLIRNGGFPEPFLSDTEADIDRWRMQYINDLLNIDLLEFENLQKLRAVKLIFEILQTRVGYPISFKSIAEDLRISPNTVKKYIEILENLYVVFSVRPFSKNIARSILKSPKIYFFDTGLVKGDVGVKLENLASLSLLKHCFEAQDILGRPHVLHYLKTKEGKEVDFCITDGNDILKVIEVKHGDDSPSKTLKYFHDKYGLSAFQVVQNLKRERRVEGISIVRAENFFSEL